MCPSSPTVQGQYLLALPADLLYKAIPAEPYWSRVVTYWYPSSHFCTISISYGYPCSPTIIKSSTERVSQQPYPIWSVPYGYPSSPNVQGQYPIGITADPLYKDSIIWVFQQPYCTRAVLYGIPAALLYKISNPTIQVLYPMGILAVLQYKDIALWIFQ